MTKIIMQNNHLPFVADRIPHTKARNLSELLQRRAFCLAISRGMLLSVAVDAHLHLSKTRTHRRGVLIGMVLQNK